MMRTLAQLASIASGVVTGWSGRWLWDHYRHKRALERGRRATDIMRSEW